jgi:polysaccharide export outer membrane protein
MDPEVNALFNPSSQGDGFSSSTTQMYGAPIGREVNGYRVSQKGTITIPMLGEIMLAGLSLEEAQNRLRETAEEFLIDPHIQIKFLNYKVDLLGEVRFPGIYYNYEGKISILEAIGMANGITDFADIKNTLVKRHVGNKVVTIKLDLTDSSVYSSDVFYLQPNDLVYIPPSKLKRRQVNVQTYSMVLSTISVLLVSVTLITNL